MNIVGIEELEFGVDDVEACRRFAADFGLKEIASEDAEHAFETLNGARIKLHGIDADLPPAFEAGSTLRRITYGVADSHGLDVVRKVFSDQPNFLDEPEAVSCRDPNGMTVRVCVSDLREVDLDVPAINQWGDVRRIDEPSPVYEHANPISVGHTVFFVEDLEATEKFYREKLGFAVSDRYVDRAAFLRMQERGGHHNLFLLKLPNKPAGLNHTAFVVRDIHEVIGGGIAMNRENWSTFIGPGRHPVSSAYFWYVNSPMGGAFEYYTNDDYLTENWTPRELEHSLVSFTEWAVEGGIDTETRRQKKADLEAQ